MRRPYRLARPVPRTACLSASLILWAKMNLITTQAKRNLSSRSGIGGVLSAT